MNTAGSLSFNHQLRLERIRRNWRQQDLADELGTTVTSVKRWERGSQQPSVYFRVKLCALFERSAEEFGLVTERTQSTQSTHMPETAVQDEDLSTHPSSEVAAESQATLICGAIQAMAHFFPSNELDGEDWRRSEQLLPHALICIHQSEQHGYLFPESITLLTKVAIYLLDRARFCEAEPLLQKALQIKEQTQGTAHLDTAYIVNDLANLYRGQGKYAQAEPLFQRALKIKQHALGPKHPLVAVTLHNLALFYSDLGEEKQAELLFQQAFEIWKQSPADGKFGDADKVGSPFNFTKVAAGQRKYTQAESLYQRVVEIWQQRLGAEHPKVAILRHNLAILYVELGKYEQAEALFQRVLYIEERHLDPEHPEIATTLHNLALLYVELGKYELGEPLFQRALAFRQKSLGPQHLDIAKTLSCLTNIHQMQQHITLKTFSRDQQTRTVSNHEAFSVERRRDERPACPVCEQVDAVVCSGVNRAGTQRFRCRSCQRYFTPSTRPRGYHPTLKAQAVILAEKGMSARTIAQKLEVHHSTVSLWIKALERPLQVKQ